MIKDHMSTIAMLLALTLMLVTVLVMVLTGKLHDSSPVLLTLVTGVTTIVGAIAGKQLSNAPSAPPSGSDMARYPSRAANVIEPPRDAAAIIVPSQEPIK